MEKANFWDSFREVKRGWQSGGRRGRSIIFNALSPSVDRWYQGQPWLDDPEEDDYDFWCDDDYDYDSVDD